MPSTRFLRTTLALTAFLGGIASAAAPARADVGRLPTDIVPTFEAIRLDLDADKMDYSGAVRVELKVLKATKTIQFHAQEMKLGKIVLIGKGGPPKSTPQEAVDGLVTPTAPRRIVPGPSTLAVSFSTG